MSNPFIAEIRMFTGNFAPKGWAFCDGQLIVISQNTALFSLLGTTYGGDGKSNFALPNLQGMSAMHPGQGPGLSLRDLGETGGVPTVTLLTSEIPLHSHTLVGSTSPGAMPDPGGNALGTPSASQPYATGSTVAMGDGSVMPTGGGQPHNNLMPFLTVNFIIALSGVFPSRS